MRRTKALILVATLAVLTSVAACSWQAEPLPAESAQSESSLSTSESAMQETAEEERQIPDLSGVPEPSPEPAAFPEVSYTATRTVPGSDSRTDACADSRTCGSDLCLG